MSRCERCEDSTASVTCAQCHMSFCTDCSGLLHAKGKFREHQVAPLAALHVQGQRYGVVPLSPAQPSDTERSMYGSTPTGVDRDTKASNAPQSPSPAPKQPQGLPSSNNANLPVRRAVAPNNGVGRRGGPTGPGGAAIKRSVSIVPPPSAFNVAATSAAPAAAGGAAPYGSLPTGRDADAAPSRGAAQQPTAIGVAGYGTIPMAEGLVGEQPANVSGNYGNVPVKQADSSVPQQYSAVPAGKPPSSGYGDLPAPAPAGAAAAAAAAEEDARWQPLRDTEGRLYYVNSQTGETSWTKPETNKRAVPLATYQHLTQVKAGDMNRSRPPPDRVAVAGASNLPNGAGRGGGGGGPGPAGGGGGAAAAEARRRAATSPTRPSASARAAALSQRRLEKSGWMNKDGKPRWFLLREQMLYWFTREQPLGADVSRDVRNFVDLSSGCTVRPNYASKRGGFELAIETTLPAKQFVFACQSQAELDGWLAALVEGRARGSEARINGHVRFDRQRRYAVLDASQLRFFADESCRELRAAVDLGSCQPLAPPTNGETTLVLKGALGRTYEIGFQDAAQTLEWRAALDNVQRKASEATQLKRVVTQRKLEHKMANALSGGKALAASSGGGGGGSGNGTDLPPALAASSSQSELELPLAAGELPPMKEAKVNADVKDMPFFHSGRIGAEAAYDLLVGHRVGSYLVRESSRAGCFVVSWIQSDEAIVHTLLAPSPNGVNWIIEGDDRLYTSIMAILATYSMSYRYPVNANQ